MLTDYEKRVYKQLAEKMTTREAIEILQEEHNYCQEPSYVKAALFKAIKALENPTIDAEPVKHGRWRGEMVKRCDWRGKKQQYYQPNSCSMCHEAVAKRTPYCPNCGAKMDGGDDNA